MPRVQTVVKGSAPSLLEAEKANELIQAVNGLANIVALSPVKAIVAADWNRVTLELDMEALKTQLANIGGGGVPDGFIQEQLDVVLSDNTAGLRTFLTSTDAPS